MNISGTSNSISSFSALQSLQPQPVVGDADPADAGTSRPHRAHGGGHMRQAVTQALQSLGLSMPSTNSTSATSSTSSDGSSSDSSSTSATSGVQQDMRQFMHSLFEAVKDGSSSSASTATAGSDPQSTFASGLSSLISQVSAGSAPADLQASFSKLASDLQASGATANSPDAASTSGPRVLCRRRYRPSSPTCSKVSAMAVRAPRRSAAWLRRRSERRGLRTGGWGTLRPPVTATAEGGCVSSLPPRTRRKPALGTN